MIEYIRGDDMNNWQLTFKRWLNENRRLSERSLGHYAGAIKSIMSWVGMDISDIASKEKYKEFEQAALKNSTFILRDSTGNNMYSVALRHFGEFIAAEIPEESIIYPEVVSGVQLVEGGKKQITINAYERNPYARKKCIEYFGAKCVICGFDFAKVYGDDFSGIIHVHHIKPLSEISDEYIIDPIRDLVPVCPNCHLVIHSKPDGVYTIEEIKQLMLKAKQ